APGPCRGSHPRRPRPREATPSGSECDAPQHPRIVARRIVGEAEERPEGDPERTSGPGERGAEVHLSRARMGITVDRELSVELAREPPLTAEGKRDAHPASPQRRELALEVAL